MPRHALGLAPSHSARLDWMGAYCHGHGSRSISRGARPRKTTWAPHISRIHVVFRQVVSVDWRGIGPDLPVLSSIDWRAAALSAMAMIAMFRLRLGMLPTLAICGLAGMVLAALG